MEQALSFTDSLLMALAILGPMGTAAVAFLILPRIRIPPGSFGSVAALCVIGLGVGIIALLGAAGLAPVPGGLILPPRDALAAAQAGPTTGFTPLQLVLVSWVATSGSALLLVGTWRAARTSRKAEREAAAQAEGRSTGSLFHDKRWD